MNKIVAALVAVVGLVGCANDDSGTYSENVPGFWRPDLRARVQVEHGPNTTRAQREVIGAAMERIEDATGLRLFDIVPAVGHPTARRIFIDADNDLADGLVGRIDMNSDSCQIYVPEWASEAVLTHELLRCIGFAPVTDDASDVMYFAQPSGNEIKPYVIGEIWARVNKPWNE